MTMILTPKRATFSASHRLDCFGPDHKCARDHGHTWWVQASFAGMPIDGLLIGYEVVPEIVRPFDHVNLNEAEVMRGLLPTAENVLSLLVDRLEVACERAGPHVQVVRVELIEDPIPGDAHSIVWVRSGWEWCRP